MAKLKNFIKDLLTETNRLVVRPLEYSDFKCWSESHISRLPPQHKYDNLLLPPEDYSLENFKLLVARNNKEMEKDIYYGLAAFDKISGMHVGKIDITTLMRDEFQWSVIGYIIHNTFQNSGYGTEMLKAALIIAFEKLKFKRVEAHINTDNERSIRVAEKAGMVMEVVRKNFIYEYGQWTDNAVYVSLNEKFTESPDKFC